MSSAGEKTEKPTPKRISEARKKGQVAKSTDLTSSMVIASILLVLSLFGPMAMTFIVRIFRHFVVHQLVAAGTTPITPDSFHTLFTHAVIQMMLLMSPFLVGALVMAFGVNLFQIKPMVAFEAIKPKLSKLNPIEGSKRMFSRRAWVELGKGILKILLVGAVCYGVIQNHLGHLFSTSQMSLPQSGQLVFQVITSMTFGVAIALFVLGVADWRYQIFELMKQLRMSKQEIKDEIRNTEGNPEIKRKLKSTGQAMLTKRMLANVPQADVILTNPTHYSVAIQYDPDECPAPRVIAKGADALAFKIREIAKEHRIPIHENKPLARALYDTVEVEHMIPPHLFVAVAQVLAFVFTKSKGRKSRAKRWGRLLPAGGNQ